MEKKNTINIGEEFAKIHPLILREIVVKQMKVMGRDNLSLTHIAILDMLKERGACRMGDIADLLGITLSAVTGIIDKMTEMKLVKRERSGTDRRVVMVLMLPKGKRIVEKTYRMKIDVVNDVFSVFTYDEKKEYLRLLTKVYTKLRG
ncbi:MAG: MarR family transcriptional regulator [Candidatus Aadella gelida]|nr:MarR family transcriptional regulator [Candidatus Aadella gelida]